MIAVFKRGHEKSRWLLLGHKTCPPSPLLLEAIGWLQTKAEKADSPFGSAEYSICRLRLKRGERVFSVAPTRGYATLFYVIVFERQLTIQGE